MMVQGTTINSTGTTLSGGDGSGTQSGIIAILQDIKNFRRNKGIKNSIDKLVNKKKEGEKEDSSSESDDPIDVEFEEDQQNRLSKSEEHQRLSPVSKEQHSFPLSRRQLRKSEDSIEDREPILLDVQIGNLHIQEHYTEFDQLTDKLDLEQQEALNTALSGGLPDREVSISASTQDSESIRFIATPEANIGWHIEGTEFVELTADEIEKQLDIQDSQAVYDIKAVMHETFDGDGPHIVSGPNFTVAMDDDTVFVFESETGRMVDVVEIDNISQEVVKASQVVNGQTRNEQVREALADFEGAAIATAPTPSNKQRELLP